MRKLVGGRAIGKKTAALLGLSMLGTIPEVEAKVESTYAADEVMRMFKLTRQTLYYWRKNLLPARGSGTGKDILYTEDDITCIKTILNLKEKGLSTNTITRVIKRMHGNVNNMSDLLKSEQTVVCNNGKLFAFGDKR